METVLYAPLLPKPKPASKLKAFCKTNIWLCRIAVGAALCIVLVGILIILPINWNDVGGMAEVIIVFVSGALLYLLPTFIAFGSKRKNSMAIFLLNLLLGWTFLGWVGALIWAVTDDK